MADKWLKIGILMNTAINNAAFNLQERMRKENGDTNLISIIIVLGIVLALVIIFKDFIKQIVDKIKDSVANFNTNVT